MREYETIVLVKPDVGDEPLNKLAQRIKSIVDTDGGKFLQMSSWGKKKLAYEIAKYPKAIFLHANYLSKSNTPKELERNLRISDDVIRYLTVQLEDAVDPASRDAKELETLKVVAEAEDEDPFRPRREEHDEGFGPMGEDFEGGFDENEAE
ncbi:MAG: 30S ribosomal protein S6 [Deltaproteobacteria bacterium]|nr:30S ribosomal protein S6 [Deltaproteobacteria bacterium]